MHDALSLLPSASFLSEYYPLVLRAADAVLTGHTENIIAFHMKNISKDKSHLMLVRSLLYCSF